MHDVRHLQTLQFTTSIIMANRSRPGMPLKTPKAPVYIIEVFELWVNTLVLCGLRSYPMLFTRGICVTTMRLEPS